MRYHKEFTPNFKEILTSQSFTAVIVASRNLPCATLGPYFQLVPFFVVSGSSQNCDQDLDFNRVYYLMPPDSSLMASFFEAVKQYKWKSAAVLYDKNDEVQFTFQNIQDAGDRGLDVVAFEAKQSDESIRSKLIQARRKGIRTYVLVSSYTRLIRIMSIARQLSLSTENYHWFIPNVLLNPQVLHNFLDDGVRITFLHSPLVTPLVLKIVEVFPELQTDGNKLYQTVVQSLVRIASRAVLEVCESFRTDPKFSELKTHIYHHQKVRLCTVDVSNGILINATDSLHTTAQYVATTTQGHAHGATTTSTTTPPDHGHGMAPTTTTTPSSGHGHGMAPTSSAPSSGHGHGMATTTATTPSSGHGHGMATTTTTTPSSGHGHGMATTTTTTPPSGHGHGMAATTTTTPPSDHGHGMAITTITTPSSGHGHGMATTTTTTPSSGHGHGMATTTTTTPPSGHGHAMAMSTTTPASGHTMTTSSTTPMAHAMARTIMSGGHDHGITKTTSTAIGHGHAMSTTTVVPSSIHGHSMVTTTPTPSSGHGHGMAPTITTTPSSGHGHAMAPTTTTPSSGHGHGMTSTTTTPSGHGHGHGMTTTTTSVAAGHGHATTTTKTPSGHGHATTTSGHNAHGGHDVNSGVDKKFEACLIKEAQQNDVIPPTSPGPTAPSHGGHHRRKRQADHHQHSSKFEIATRFDPCPFASTYAWNYNESTVEASLLRYLKVNDSNPVYTIEHVHAEVNGQNVHQLLNVGGRNGARGYVNVTYEKFAVERVKLPTRDLIVGAVWNPPWLKWEIEDGVLVPGTYEGYLYDVIKALAETMKFNFSMNDATAQRFGPESNLSETELEFTMNELFENGTCDIFLYDKIIQGGRILLSDIVSITISIQTPKMYLLTKRVEKNQGVSIWQFLAPFKEESWVVLWSTLVLVALLMTYINKKNPYEFRRASRDLRPGAKHSEHLGFLNSMWFNFAALVEQSSQLLPKSGSLKVLAGTWWLFVMLVIAAYTANMISFMTQVDSEGITTLEQLASQQEVKYGILADNPMLQKLLPLSKDHPYSTMWHYLRGREKEAILPNLEEALSKVSKGDFMLVSSFKTVVQALAASCDNDQVGDGFYRYQVGLPVRKGLIFLPAINDNISHLRDVGKLTDLEEKWFGDVEQTCETTSLTISLDNGGQLDIKAFIGMYVFLGLGVAMGMLICLLETTYIKYGGIGGVTGRARRYSLRKNQREFLKPEAVMEAEFEQWPGGWEVLKHKAFIEEQHDSHVKLPDATSVKQRTETVQSRKGDVIYCPGCGQESEKLPDFVTKRFLRRRSTIATITNTIDDTISVETGYRSGATSPGSQAPDQMKKI